jgi:hypothetical protein
MSSVYCERCLGEVFVYVGFCGADGSCARPLQACAALPGGHPLKGYALYKDYVGVLPLADLTKECGLPASTVTLTPPALTTCEGAAYKFSSFERYCAPVCVGDTYLRAYMYVCDY